MAFVIGGDGGIDLIEVSLGQVFTSNSTPERLRFKWFDSPRLNSYTNNKDHRRVVFYYATVDNYDAVSQGF